MRDLLEPGAAERALGRATERTESNRIEGPKLALSGGTRVRPLSGRAQRRLSRRAEESVPQRVRIHRRQPARRRFFDFCRRPQRDRHLRCSAQELARAALGGCGILRHRALVATKNTKSGKKLRVYSRSLRLLL